MTGSLGFAAFAAAGIVAFVPLTSLDLAPPALLLGNIRFLELDPIANRSLDHAHKALQVLTLHQSRDTLYPHILLLLFLEEAVASLELAKQLLVVDNLECIHLDSSFGNSPDFKMHSLIPVPSG